MARTQVMKLWTVVVTAFLALFTALGLSTPAAAAPVTQTERSCNSTQPTALPARTLTPWSLSYARSLPPTMKQRIRAEAHGSSPSCRHRALPDRALSVPAAADSTTAPLPEAHPEAPFPAPPSRT